MEGIQLLGETKRRILEQLRRGPSTAQVLAHDFGVQVSAVRGHLEGMETQGLVAARFQRAGVGRPRKIYELTSAAQELFPRRYHQLLTGLLTHLVEKEGRAYVETLLAELAREVAADLQVPTDGDPETRARAAAEALSAMGFEATVEHTDQGLALVRRNCIFLDAAREHHELVCDRFDQELVKATLGTEARLSSCMATGGHACRNVLRIGPDRKEEAGSAG